MFLVILTTAKQSRVNPSQLMNLRPYLHLPARAIAATLRVRQHLLKLWQPKMIRMLRIHLKSLRTSTLANLTTLIRTRPRAHNLLQNPKTIPVTQHKARRLQVQTTPKHRILRT
jgi:hypothetical protein